MSGEPLPPRTVPDDILGFSCRTYMAGDADERYPNAHGVHPAEFKVELRVRRVGGGGASTQAGDGGLGMMFSESCLLVRYLRLE